MKIAGSLLAATFLALLAAMPVAALEGVTEKTVEEKFENVAQDVADAIVNRGYIVDHRSFIGNMLERTRESVGSDKVIYRNAELVQFCSAVLSRRMMEADPANIAYCAYVIFYYELPGKPGKVHVGFRHLTAQGSDASKAAVQQINALLEEIFTEVTGE